MNGLIKVLTGCVTLAAAVAIGFATQEFASTHHSPDRPVLKVAVFSVSGNEVGDYPALRLDIENAGPSLVTNCRMTWEPGVMDSTKTPEVIHSDYFSLNARAAMGFTFVAHTAHRLHGWTASEASVTCDGIAGLSRSQRLYVG